MPERLSKSWDGGLKWHELTDHERFHWQHELDPIDGKLPVDELALISVAYPAFYQDGQLLRITSPRWEQPELEVYFATKTAEPQWRLDGTSAGIHLFNASAPVRLSEANVLDYLRYFCFFIHAELGPFLVAEDVDDRYIRAHFTDADRVRLREHLRPAQLLGEVEEGFGVATTMLYGHELLSTIALITRRGMVDLPEEAVLLDRLEGRIRHKLTA